MPDPLPTLASSLIEALQRRRPLPADEHVDAVLQLLADEHLHGAGPELDQAALDRLRTVFHLDEIDLRLLLVAAAADLDHTLGVAIGLVQGAARSERVGAAVALELAGSDGGNGADRSRLYPDSALVGQGLLRVEGDGPFPDRRLRVPDRVVAHLLGGTTADPLTDRLQVPAVPLDSGPVDELVAALRVGPSFCYLHQRAGTGVSLAAAAFARLTVPALAVDLRRRPADVGAGSALSSVLLDAGLLGQGLILIGVDEAAETDPLLLRRIADAPVPVIAIGNRRWDDRWLDWLPLCVQAPPVDPAVRATLWARLLDESGAGLHPPGPDAPGWAELFALTVSPEEIGQVVASALLLARAEQRPLTVADLRHTTRRLGATTLAGGLHRREPSVGFDDLVLPEATLRTLQELVGWARHRDAVLALGPITGKGGKGRGLVALFAGSPGTGKTLAAQVVASALGLDLQTVDLSTVVDKYIGETEKNLERIFHQAEAMNCVLLFDEADALFGSRSDVRDAKDRYANQEVAYLLQRIEAFDGIAILATNLRGNLDPAFSRRLHFIVSFPDPDRATRRRLWQAHLTDVAELDPADPIDLDVLAEHFELAGGDIRNIVMAAVFTAVTRGESLGRRHLREAVQREYLKLARMLPPAGMTALGRGLPDPT